ncbi:hypothetical protein Esti_001938 [Eimeria stiedai]
MMPQTQAFKQNNKYVKNTLLPIVLFFHPGLSPDPVVRGAPPSSEKASAQPVLQPQRLHTHHSPALYSPAAAAAASAAAAATSAAAAATSAAAAATSAAAAAAAAATAAAAAMRETCLAQERPTAGSRRIASLLEAHRDSDWGCSSGSSNSSSNVDASSVCTLEDDESQEESPPASCLLCPFRCSTSAPLETSDSSNSSSSSSRAMLTPAAVVLQHMWTAHGLNLCAKRGWLAADEQQRLPPLNSYSRIALVSFLRQQQQQEGAGAAALALLTPEHRVFSCPDELLAAADPQEPLLWDADDCSTDQENEPSAAAAAALGGEQQTPECDANAAAAATGGKWKGFVPPVVPHNSETYEQLLCHRAAAAAASSSSSSRELAREEEGDDGLEAGAAVGGCESSAEDRGYFAGYGELSIHREMLSDAVRTEAYRNFLFQQAEKLRGKVVLDVGCGTCILSLFAAQAGARKVIALDASEPIVSVARRVVAANEFAGIIQILREKASSGVESVDLYWRNCDQSEVIAVAVGSDPPEGATPFSADCLVSEWMGYCLLYEAMLFSVLCARDKYLKPNGLLVPNKALLSVCTADFREEQRQRRGPFGAPFYNLDFSAIDLPDSHLFGQLEVLLVQQQQLNQQQQQQPLCLLDLHAVTRQEVRALRFPFEISLPAAPEACSSLVFYFDCFFEPSQHKGGPSLVAFAETATTAAATAAAKPAAAAAAEGAIVMSTSPLSEPTHWKQTVLHLLDGAGNACSFSATPQCPSLRGFASFNPSSSPGSKRSLVVTLEVSLPAEVEGKQQHVIRSYPLL